MKIEEIELMETEYKTKRKFAKTGRIRLRNRLINIENVSCMDALEQICEAVDCNFTEVLGAVCRTVR